MTNKKETIKAPNTKEKRAASKLLREGNPAGARVMADASVAARQAAAKPKGKKKP